MKTLALIVLVATTTSTSGVELITMNKRTWRYQYDRRVDAQAKAKTYKAKLAKCEGDKADVQEQLGETSGLRVSDAQEADPPGSTTPGWVYWAGPAALLFVGGAVGYALAPKP